MTSPVSGSSRGSPSPSRLSDPRLRGHRDAWLESLEGLFAGEARSTAFVLSGIAGGSASSVIEDPERCVAESLADLEGRTDVLEDAACFRPLVVCCGIYGVHFVDAVLGEDVFDLDGTGNWQVRPRREQVGSLQDVDLAGNAAWEIAARAARAFVDAHVTVPFFEMPTLSSALNVGVNLYGQDLLMALHDDPDAVRCDLAVINDLIRRMHAWYRDTVPASLLQPVVGAGRCQPPGFGQICGCSTQLMGPDPYAEHVAPFDEAVLADYPHGGMIHLCGAHAQHIPTWRDMPSLRAVQVNDAAADDLESYVDGLRDDQVMYVNPTKTMTVQRILEITGGRRVVIVAPLEEAPRIDAAGGGA